VPQGQGRTYAAVIGVTVGMLVAGLGVPLAYGRFDNGATTTAAGQSQLSQVPGSSSSTLGRSATAGATTGPAAGLGPAHAGSSSLGSAGNPSVSGLGAASGPGGPGNPSGTGKTGLRATDQGVTATTVKLGVVLLDIRALEPLGFAQPHFTPQEQQQQYQTFIDQVNREGGLNGRKIVPDYKTYNALDTNGAQSGPAICIQLAENDKVFAAIGVLGGNMDVCLTQQYGIPAISNTSQITEAYSKSRYLLMSLFASLERAAANWGDLSARTGIVTGHKTGTVSSDTPVETKPEQALVDALKADGQPVTYRAHLAGDQASAQSQLPIEIQKMQAAGVDTVFLCTNFVVAIQFVQTAEKQGFRPHYLVSDIGSITADGLVQSMPSSFDGALGFTQGAFARPEPPADTKCRTDFNKATGNHYAAGNEAAGTTLFCWMVKAFAEGARLAGTNLTRLGVAYAYQHMTLHLGHTLPGHLAPGKTDYADEMRIIKFSTACKCYQPDGQAMSVRY